MATKVRATRSKRHERLTLEVLKQFRLILGSVRHHFRRIEETCGISGSQLWVIREISAAPGIGVSALAQKLSIHQSTCSQLVETLVGRGLLTKVRLGNDQRRVGLTLRKSAAKLMAAAPRPAEGILPKALSELPNQALLTLSTQLNRLIAELQVKDRPRAH